MPRKKKEIKIEVEKELEYVEPEEFTLQFIFKDTVFTTKGETIGECIRKFDGKYINGKCVLKVEKEGKEASWGFYPALFRKLIVNKILQEITQKRLLSQLKLK